VAHICQEGGGGGGGGVGWVSLQPFTGMVLIITAWAHGQSPSQVMDARGEGWVRDRMGM
jgi:hypothetical protein